MRRVYKGRDASKMAYEIRKIIADKPKVLLTATPLQNNLLELYGIVSFIDDKLLGSEYSFKTRYVELLSEIKGDNKTKLQELRRLIWGDENDNSNGISGVLTRTLRKQVLEYVRFTERKSLTFDFTPTDEEVELYEKVSEYLQRLELAAIPHTQRNLMILVYRKLLASSTFAIAGTLKNLIGFLEKELRLREQEDAEKLVSLCLKTGTDEPPLSEIEAEDEGLEEELEETTIEQPEAKTKKGARINKDKFSDKDIKNEINELTDYYNLAISIKENTKGIALINALKSIFKEARKKGWAEKAVVFTESRRTQEYLAKLLKVNGITYTLFNGSNSTPEARKAYESWSREFPESASQGSFQANMRQALVYEFEKNSQVFLTTEAGGEGLNLQFCNIVVNYDLPWNPQRVEQRIGRCHRYGQRHEVIVANFLNTKNHADRRLLELLQEKLNLFDGLFGSSDEILGALEAGIDFEKKILAIYQTCKTPEEIDTAFNELQNSLKDAISDRMIKLRSHLLEFDDSVRGLFKKTKFDTENMLSEFDRDMLMLCSLSLGKNLIGTNTEGIYKTEYDGRKHLIAFRELKDDEIGKVSRAHREHPLISKVIDEALKIETNPISSCEFIYTPFRGKFSQIEPLKDKEGFIFLFKLKIKGVEDEEVLAPLTFVQDRKGFLPVELPAANQLLTLETRDAGIYNKTLPFSQDVLLGYWHNWKKGVLETYQKRNDRLYDREIDRINRYYHDYALKVEDRIAKLEKELADLNRKRDNSADLAERRELHKKIQKIDMDIEKLRIEQIKLKEEGFKKKQEELGRLETRFELLTEERLIAITHFRIT
ncbi:MAG: hypothetical protein A3I04_03050 [Nitrospinae bacterium RIFCSPLOWO2_02_FULL_39_110]|nr:MAG: hypothetical protein A3D20_02515 [Nitrospinae bacterium RIFCSPHIGHO2_02_FULL_39_82]OGW03657.1 MAG: hypothetical protein A3I04_03050 [Nitrospinae bacterium RIFCSPLOWO2_02_FULL_39_110]